MLPVDKGKGKEVAPHLELQERLWLLSRLSER